MTSPPVDLDEFRRFINRGLEAQGYPASWRPDGAPPLETEADREQRQISGYVRRLADAREDVRDLNRSGIRRERIWASESEASEGDKLPDLPLPLGAPRYSCHLRNPPIASSQDASDFSHEQTEQRAGALPEQLACQRPEQAPACQKAPPVDRRAELWTPTTPFVPRPVRRRMYRIRDGIRCISRPRIRACGFAVAPGADGSAGAVGCVLDEEGKARFTGLIQCGSIWECPVCQMKIKAGRARELSYAVETHGIKRCAMLTLTLRHDFEIGHDLKRVRQALANVWRATTRGEPWKRFKRRIGVYHSVRALEVTYGEVNGWHPHLHILFFLTDEIPVDEWDPHTDRWSPVGNPDTGASGIEWLIARWGDMVERELGVHARPDDVHGVELKPCRKESYLTKIGLEISDPGHKEGREVQPGRPRSRTPLQIAHDFVSHGARKDAGLWQAYCRDMKGARCITWSSGAKRAFGIRDRNDLELATDEQDAATDRTVGTIASAAWSSIRGRVVDTPEGECSATYWILEQVERGGRQAFDRAVLQVATGEVGRDEHRPRTV